MQLNDLFALHDIDPGKVIVMRHRPTAPELNKVLPWLAADQLDVFNCYQQTQVPTVEKAMLGLKGKGYLASFIGQRPGKATFVGLYAIKDSRVMTRPEFWDIPASRKLEAFGSYSLGADDPRECIEFFDLVEMPFYQNWKGKLIVDWPPPERSWWRRAERNDIPVLAILEESVFDRGMPAWEEINLTRADLGVLPRSWQDTLTQWRAIYYIYDVSDGRGYVGSASGGENLLGRWRNYAASGHGGNALLRGRDPANFRFSILQRLAPDLGPDDVFRIETSWKVRLHTRRPHGLNDN